MRLKVLSVGEISNYIKRVLDSDYILKNARIRGEVSNVTLHSTGNIYFSIKDDVGRINAIMFSSYAEELNFMIEEGMNVVITGSVTAYVKGGSYTVYAKSIEMEGVGELHAKFLKLKEELANEGIFDESHKASLPKYPSKVGVVTSITGAAIRDIINVTRSRNEKMELLIYPSLVQGVNAAQNVIQGIEALDKREDVDVIILARGGGSIEELWAFNDKDLARAVYNCKTPIVSAIGHEVDFTLADFAADLRAATPSQGAELVVPRLDDIEEKINNYRNNLDYFINNLIISKKTQVENLKSQLKIMSPIKQINLKREDLIVAKEKLDKQIELILKIKKMKVHQQMSLLEANSPLSILKRGYSIVETDNGVISSIDSLPEDGTIRITMIDGSKEFIIKSRGKK